MSFCTNTYEDDCRQFALFRKPGESFMWAGKELVAKRVTWQSNGYGDVWGELIAEYFDNNGVLRDTRFASRDIIALQIQNPK